MKKVCKKCFKEFEEDDIYISPAEIVANMMIQQDGGIEAINDLCPQCREELGIMNILGDDL